MYIENHIKHYFGRHFINSNTVGSRVGRSRGYKLRSIGEKTPKLSYMCAFHGVKWIPRRARRCCPSAPWFLAVFFPFVAIAEFKNRHSRSSGVWVVNRSGWGCPATCWHAQAHSLQVKNSCKNSGVNSLLFHFPEDRAFEVKPWEESSFLWRIGRFFYDQPQMFLEPSGISDSGAFSQSTFSDLQSEEDKGNYQFVVVVASLNYTYSCISPWRSCMTLWW